LSLLLGILMLIILMDNGMESITTLILLFLGSVFFTLYGIKPSLVKIIFRINPDEDFISEQKKDFQLIVNMFKKDKND